MEPRKDIFVLTIQTDKVESGMIVSCHQSQLSAEKAAIDWMVLYYESELRIWEGGYFEDLDFARLCEIEHDERFAERYKPFAVDIWRADNYGNLAERV